jgi:hypothetical protein
MPHCAWVSRAEHSQGAGHTGGSTPTVGTDVAGPAPQRQMHEVGGCERLLVKKCGLHAANRPSPSGLGHCEARHLGHGQRQALHAHLVQRCASLRARLCRVRGLQGNFYSVFAISMLDVLAHSLILGSVQYLYASYIYILFLNEKDGRFSNLYTAVDTPAEAA